MIKVSDYIFRRLAEHGIKQAFLVSGGGAMHLDDSLGKSQDITYTCCHHEQACAMAAEGYARVTGKPAVVVVTSGPGGTNALTGVLGQWTDSIPCIYISGQVTRETMGAGKNDLRQLGDQEINIVDIVRPMTKYAETVITERDVSWLIDKAVLMATHGRPGPVWIDIPLDVQSAMIGADGWMLGSYQGESETAVMLSAPCLEIADHLKRASRPVFLAGHGIRIAGAQKEFLELAEATGIPIVTSMGGFDLIPSAHPLFIGRVGTIGTPAGNCAVQNADMVISIGSRNNIRQVGYDRDCFARDAGKVVVDIDAAELKKRTFIPHLAVNADAKEFIKELSLKLEHVKLPDWNDWRSLCLIQRDPLHSPQNAELVDPYHFIRVLTSLLPEDAVVVSGNGTASVCLFQAGKVKSGQRMFMNSGCAAMGYDLPAAIGACIANGGKDVICITGDGSIQMNIQELQTIVHHKLPIKIFVLNNGGYHSIKQTQDNYFEGRHVGAGPDSGVSCPEMIPIAGAYGIRTMAIVGHEDMSLMIKEVLKFSGPIFCEVALTSDYKFDKQNLKIS